MHRVQGVGAVMIFARKPESLARWYADHLGIVTELDKTDGNYYGAIESANGSSVRFGIYPAHHEHDGSSIMINYKVTSLDGIKAQLANQGVGVERELAVHGSRFLYLRDPEGNRIELWESST